MKSIFSMSSKKIGIMLVVFIVASAAFGVFLYMNNPKIKFLHLINKEYQSFVSILDKAKESELTTLSEGDTITSSGNVTFDLSLDGGMFGDSLDELVNIINDFSIDYQYGSDPIKNNTYVKLNTNIDHKDFVDMELYQMGDKKYIYLKNIYDKYIESDSTDAIESQSGQTDDIIYLVNKVKQSFLTALTTSDFTTEDKTIDVNNQKINTSKITLKLTDKRLKEIEKVILTDMKNDSKCLEILNKFSDEVDAQTELDEAIASLDNEVLLDEDIAIDMYVNDNKIIKLDIFSGTTKTIEYLNYNAFYPVKTITLFDDETVVMNASFEQKSLNDISYKITFSDEQIIFSGIVSKLIESSIETKTWNMDLSFEVSLTYDNAVLGSLAIDTKTTTKIGEEIKMIDITNTIREEDLTDEDNNNISSKLLEKLFTALPINLPVPEESNGITY